MKDSSWRLIESAFMLLPLILFQKNIVSFESGVFIALALIGIELVYIEYSVN